MSGASAASSLELLKSAGVNFLACDFDLTILDIHTSGNWLGTIEDLCAHVRPQFRKLVEETLASPDMHVAIVTFSPQTSVVRDVCREVWGEAGDRIVIRGGDRTWSYEGRGSQDGKQSHLASAVEELGEIERRAKCALIHFDIALLVTSLPRHPSLLTLLRSSQFQCRPTPPSPEPRHYCWTTTRITSRLHLERALERSG